MGVPALGIEAAKRVGGTYDWREGTGQCGAGLSCMNIFFSRTACVNLLFFMLLGFVVSDGRCDGGGGGGCWGAV